MKRQQYLALLGISSIFLIGCSTDKSSKIERLLDESVVLISYKDRGGHGTGFFVPGENNECRVLTARHVVEGEDTVKIKTNDDNTINVSDIKLFKNQDLAILSFQNEDKNCDYKPWKIGNSSTVRRRDQVSISGYYNNGNQIIKHIVEGSVTAIHDLPKGYGISYQAFTFKGMSGGPVINLSGKVVAVHGRTDTEVSKLAEYRGIEKPTIQSLEDIEETERGARVNTFRWGIPIDLYLANVSNADNLIVQKNELPVSEEYNGKVQTFDDTTDLDTKSEQVWNSKAEKLFKSAKYAESLEASEKAIGLNSKLAASWINKGRALASLQKLEEALTALEKAIELDPKNSIAWNGKGSSLSALEKHAEALVAYDKAIELDSNNSLAWVEKGNALRALKKHAEALVAYDKAIEIDPDDSIAWVEKGHALSTLEREREAESAYYTAIGIDPSICLPVRNCFATMSPLYHPKW